MATRSYQTPKSKSIQIQISKGLNNVYNRGSFPRYQNKCIRRSFKNICPELKSKIKIDSSPQRKHTPKHQHQLSVTQTNSLNTVKDFKRSQFKTNRLGWVQSYGKLETNRNLSSNNDENILKKFLSSLFFSNGIKISYKRINIKFI